MPKIHSLVSFLCRRFFFFFFFYNFRFILFLVIYKAIVKYILKGEAKTNTTGINQSTRIAKKFSGQLNLIGGTKQNL